MTGWFRRREKINIGGQAGKRVSIDDEEIEDGEIHSGGGGQVSQ